jgi:hypothetical protein
MRYSDTGFPVNVASPTRSLVACSASYMVLFLMINAVGSCFAVIEIASPQTAVNLNQQLTPIAWKLL